MNIQEMTGNLKEVINDCKGVNYFAIQWAN